MIRDHRGEFYAGLSKFTHKVPTPEAAELLAGLKALNLAIDAGFRNLVLEGDNASVINALQQYEDGLVLGFLVANICGLSQRCNAYSFSFIKR